MEKKRTIKTGFQIGGLVPNTEGKPENILYPGPHSHEDKIEVFYVLKGTTSFLVGNKWVDAGKGTFIQIPTNTLHTFANRTYKGLNFCVPGRFEKNMLSIVAWFGDEKNFIR